MPIVNINGVKLHYEIAGQGQPVVFLHGLIGSTNDWVSQKEFLSVKYKVVAIDLRGHGKSEVPKTQSEYSIPIFVEDVLGIIDLLGIKKCCLVGHSIGGFIALQFALLHQDRLASLVLVNTSSGKFERNPSSTYILSQKIIDMTRLQGITYHFERKMSFRNMVMTSAAGYIHSLKAVAKWQPITTRLSEIKVPTLIYWGDEDTPFADAVKILEKGIVGSTLITVRGAAHSPHKEAAEIFNQSLLKFLENF
jgi:pimeloyl-ACP methyl ester carboxylesterase